MTVNGSEETLSGFDTSDDLDAFSAEFFGSPKAPEKEEKADPQPDEVEETELEEGVEADDSLEDTEAESDEDTEAEAEPEKPKKKSAAERIKELTAEKYEIQRMLEQKHQADIEKLKQEIQNLSDSKQEEARAPSPEAPSPTATDKDGNLVYPLGEYDPKFIQDLTKFTFKQEAAAAETIRKQEEQARNVQVARDEAQKAWVEKVNATKEEVPDIVEKIGKIDTIVGPVEPGLAQYLVDVIRSLDNGPKVIAYLADNPDAAREIVNSGPASATVKLGRLDAVVAKPKVVETKTPTKAKTPPVQAPRGTHGRFLVSADTDDLDAFSEMFFAKK